jgi:hypothetical protein
VQKLQPKKEFEGVDDEEEVRAAPAAAHPTPLTAPHDFPPSSTRVRLAIRISSRDSPPRRPEPQIPRPTPLPRLAGENGGAAVEAAVLLLLLPRRFRPYRGRRRQAQARRCRCGGPLLIVNCDFGLKNLLFVPM